MTFDSKNQQEVTVELSGHITEDWKEMGNCLKRICDFKGHVCGGLGCVKTPTNQHKQLMILFRTHSLLSTLLNLESLLNLEKTLQIITSIIVEVFLDVLQTEQK